VNPRAKLSCVVALAVASSACGDPPPDEAASSGSDLAISPERGGPPSSYRPPRPPPPPPPADPPLFIGDASSISIIQHDADAFWLQWFEGVDDVGNVQASFRGTGSPDFWGLQQRLDALIKMYDLLLPIDRVRAMRYLDRLHAICNVLLANRDDHRSFAQADPFRGRIMQAWGAYTPDRDNQWNTDPVTSGNFIYAMAAFARRVADNPTLFCQDSLADAVRFTTAAFETYMEFHDELAIGSTTAWYNEPSAYGKLLCDEVDDGVSHRCKGYRDRAGQPIAFNEDLSMMRAMAEAAVAANSTLYRSSPDGSDADIVSALRMYYLTNEAPVVLLKNVQWFHDNLAPNVWSNGAVYWDWHSQPGNSWAQDTPHAQYELGSLVAIFELKSRLDAILAASGHSDDVPLDAMVRGFANTFLLRVWTYDYSDATGVYQNILAGAVDGTGDKSPTKNSNVECGGWTTLSQIDNWVWVRCRDSVFKSNFSGGNYLRVDNHASLLRYRQGPTSNPAQPPPPPVSVACGTRQTAGLLAASK
jgi:hypothetical protein